MPCAGKRGATFGSIVLPGRGIDFSVCRQCDCQRHGQGGIGGPEDRRHVGVDRHAKPFFASGRGHPRGSGTHTSRRRGADALAKRRHRRGQPSAAIDRGAGHAVGGHDRPQDQQAWASGQCRHRFGPAAGSLFAWVGPQHQHHGDVGGGRCAGVGNQPDAQDSAETILRDFIPAAVWAANWRGSKIACAA